VHLLVNFVRKDAVTIGEERLNETNRDWVWRAATRALWTICLALLITGCRTHEKSGDRSLLARLSRAGHLKVEPPKPGELAEKGRAEITEECAKQSYETASKGLIVSEIGLHEDVFMLRDRVTYGAIGYSLDEALRLESLLRTEADGTAYPAEQAECIRQFAEHLESISDPLEEGDERLKELDASAFKDAERQTEEKLREADKATDPKRPQQDQQPENY
jgi:hypothetical protein